MLKTVAISKQLGNISSIEHKVVLSIQIKG